MSSGFISGEAYKIILMTSKTPENISLGLYPLEKPVEAVGA